MTVLLGFQISLFLVIEDISVLGFHLRHISCQIQKALKTDFDPTMFKEL